MFKRGFTSKAAQFLERFKENFLDDILDFALTTRISPGGGKNAWLIFHDERFKARSVAFQDLGNQL